MQKCNWLEIPVHPNGVTEQVRYPMAYGVGQMNDLTGGYAHRPGSSHWGADGDVRLVRRQAKKNRSKSDDHVDLGFQRINQQSVLGNLDFTGGPEGAVDDATAKSHGRGKADASG